MLEKERKGMSIEDFKMLKVIGEGSFAQVILARKNDNGQTYAIKKLKKKTLERKQHVNHVMSERRVLAHFDHPFIVKLFYSFRSAKSLFFVLEFCQGGELFNLIEQRKKLTEDEARFYSAQMVLALEHIHARNVIYRDLKPENVVFDTEGYIRLTDFGLCKENVYEDNEAKSICGTPEYMAPEVLYKVGHGRPVDWWCLGSIIYEMLTGLPPFHSVVKAEIFEKIKFSDPKPPAHLSKNAKHLLERLLCKKAEDRLGSRGAEEIKSHPWYAEVDWQALLEKKVKAPFVPVIKSDSDVQWIATCFTSKDLPAGSLDSRCSDESKFAEFSYDGEEFTMDQE